MSKALDPSYYEENETVVFEDGLFGFEQYKKYLPLPMEKDDGDFICLLCTEDESLSFVAVNPFVLIPDYQPRLTAEDYKKLGTDKEDELCYYVICVLSENSQNSTVNLKCPIVINSVTRSALQVILQTDKYKFRHLLLDFAKGRD